MMKVQGTNHGWQASILLRKPMKMLKPVLSLLVILCLASACSALVAQVAPATAVPATALLQPTFTPAPAVTQLPTFTPVVSQPGPTTAVTGAALTADTLRNMEFNLPVSQKTVRLVDGKYEAGSGADYLLVSVAGPLAFGDMNGDGLADAALILGENMGGSGVFESLVVVFNQGGVPTQWAAAKIGDRVKVNALAIHGPQVVMDLLVPGPNDPMCCPSLAETQTYRLTKGGLFLTGLTTKTPTSEVRSITIHSPLDFSEAGTAVEIKGDFSIAPFENTFTYTIQDDSHHLLDQGSFQVKPDTQGGPGSFDVPIDLSKSSPGMIIHLDVQDVSTADGSVLASGSVELLRK
jgi:hypothetical protein